MHVLIHSHPWKSDEALVYGRRFTELSPHSFQLVEDVSEASRCLAVTQRSRAAPVITRASLSTCLSVPARTHTHSHTCKTLKLKDTRHPNMQEISYPFDRLSSSPDIFIWLRCVCVRERETEKAAEVNVSLRPFQQCSVMVSFCSSSSSNKSRNSSRRRAVGWKREREREGRMKETGREGGRRRGGGRTQQQQQILIRLGWLSHMWVENTVYLCCL